MLTRNSTEFEITHRNMWFFTITSYETRSTAAWSTMYVERVNGERRGIYENRDEAIPIPGSQLFLAIFGQ